MLRLSILIKLLLILIVITSCQSQNSLDRHSTIQKWLKRDDKIKVLTTTPILNDLIQAIGGDFIDSISLIPNDVDPHSYQMVKGDDELLRNPDLIFFHGLGLEHGPGLLRYLNEHLKASNIGNFIANHYPHLILTYQGQVDPHLWLDLSLWSKTIPFIVEKLSQADPKNAYEYEVRGKELEQKYLDTHALIKRQLQAIDPSKRYLVTSHEAFYYFTKAYLALDSEQQDSSWKERFIAPEGLAPEGQLSIKDIQNVVNYIQKHGVKVIFSESNVGMDSLKKITATSQSLGYSIRLSKQPLYGDILPENKVSDSIRHLQMLLHNADVIVKELGEI